MTPCPCVPSCVGSQEIRRDDGLGSWRRKVDSGAESWVLRLEYTSGQDEYGPDEYRAFTDFHRKLVGAIELPMVIE